MNVGDLLKKKGQDVITISADNSFDDARTLMNQKRIGALMVVNKDNSIAGIVTERDLLSKMDQAKGGGSVVKLMTPKDTLITLAAGDSLQKAMKIFTDKRIRHLPVMDGDKLLGMLSIGDAVKALLDAVELENKYLKEYIMGQDYQTLLYQTEPPELVSGGLFLCPQLRKKPRALVRKTASQCSGGTSSRTNST